MIKESQNSILINIEADKEVSILKLHTCPICGLTYLVPEEQTELQCNCGTIVDISPECLLEELIYVKNEDTNIEGVYEIPEKGRFDLDYCNTFKS